MQGSKFYPVFEFGEYYETVILVRRSQAAMQRVVARDEAQAYCKHINFPEDCFCTVAGLGNDCTPLVGGQTSFITLDTTARSRVLAAAAASEQPDSESLPAATRVRSRSRASPSLVPLE